MFNRRSFLATSASALALSNTRLASAQDDLTQVDFADADVRDILLEELEPGSLKEVINVLWFQQPADRRADATWPSDSESYEYCWIEGRPEVGSLFELTGDTVAALVQANSFPLTEGRILFGLRGCEVGEGDHRQLRKSVQLVTARPDHLHLKCVIGVWDPASNNLAAFSASTVPNVDLMDLFVRSPKHLCNMMPTGAQTYAVGLHRGKKLLQAGAFIQRDQLFVTRSKGNLTYSFKDQDDVWDDLNGSLPFDDIHAALLDARVKPPFFSSCGCQTVAGGYTKSGIPTGQWADFRVAAGLTQPEKASSNGTTPDDGAVYTYVLVTGDEAFLASRGKTNKLRALRLGSAGADVKKLQAAIGASETGTFDRKTLGSVLNWQLSVGLPMNGIVSDKGLSLIGI